MNEQQKPIYPVDPWTVRETAFRLETNYRNETTFALSNGYIGVRGTFEEAYDLPGQGMEGNFLNGFYESEPIRYGECCFGFPSVSQTMLNLPNAKIIRLWVDGEPFDQRTGTLLQYERTLHLDRGIVTRDLEWTSPAGKTIRLSTERLVCLTRKRLMAIRYTVTPLNFSGELLLESAIDGDVQNHTREANPLIDYGPYGRRLLPLATESADGKLRYRGRTQNTGLEMECACAHLTDRVSSESTTGETGCAVCYRYPAEQGREVTLVKLAAYASEPDIEAKFQSSLLDETLARGAAAGFDTLLREQREAMDRFWKTADIEIDGDEALQQGLRFNLFHIMQAAGRDGRTGMGAKGLSGEGYEGHYFWDTEMYVLPVFTLTNPDLSKSLLEYRYATLDEARERAREMGHPKGALYPWRTINGREASAYYPLGAAQYHINGDIAYAFRQYLRTAGEDSFLPKAAEVLCETARVWADVGSFSESRGGRYCICCVTGPDEYNALVDNNFYTNLMARENLRDALEALGRLRERMPDEYEALVKKLDLQAEERALWQEIIDRMYLPYSEELGIFPQDDGFLQRKPWNEERIPPEKRHLLYENYHPLFVFRHRMSKQADAILGLYLHDDRFTQEELRRNYDYYQTVTLHHSSLSTCIFGMVACSIGRYDEAFRYFTQSARMDLDDYHENFYAGIHAANMAGTWLSLVNGFAGLRVGKEAVRLRPHLPEAWRGYRFRFRYQGALVEVKVDQEGVCCRALKGRAQLELDGKRILLQEGEETHGKTVSSNLL